MEYKFRAWSNKLKEMFDVQGMVWNNGKLCYVSQFSHGRSFEDIELMQYTGLKDKNGKEIYDGDIINTKYDVVLIKNNGTNFYPYRNKDGAYNKVTNWESVKNGEIIGNIYENNELLEVTK